MNDSPAAADLHDREADFHDEWARNTPVEQVYVNASFEAITALEGRIIVKLLGDLRGRRVLDIGCGLGESSIYFAQRGADVTAVDVSPEMVRLCEANAIRLGVKVKGIVAAGEKIKEEHDSYDVVYAANVLHHVGDKAIVLKHAFDALKPGGIFIAWDPVAYNPVINVYRRLATKVRTADEMPLRKADVELSRRYFPDLRYRTTWLTTLTLFMKYYLINRYHPNDVRYWKRILEETPATIGWWFTPLSLLDACLLRIPGLRWWAWNIIQWGTKPIPPSDRVVSG